MYGVHQFRDEHLPLLGLAGSQGQALLAPALGTGLVTDPPALLRAIFHKPSSVFTESSAFTALRILDAQHKALASEPDAVQACQAWMDQCILPAFTDPRPLPSSPHQHSQQHPQPVWSLASGLQQAAELITHLHARISEDDPDSSSDDEPDHAAQFSDSDSTSEQSDAAAAQQRRRAVLAALKQRGLPGAVQVMAQHVEQALQATANSESASAQPAEPEALLAAIQTHLHHDLKLRHAPIEWLYDGLDPLLPSKALAKGKAAPFTLAVITAMICGRLGRPAVPIRAAAPTPQVAPGAAAVAGGVLMPEDVAARQAGRTASFIPTDSWLVGLINHHGPTVATSLSDPLEPLPLPTHVGIGAIAPTTEYLTDAFLDVSVRGGAVLDRLQVRRTYPEALPLAKKVSAFDSIGACCQYVQPSQR